MKGFEGNKTLLPLVAAHSLFRGSHPILTHILNNLPRGPKALVVNHKKEEVMEATRALGLTYYVQPVLNGTGGALLAASAFLREGDFDPLIITMGDVPFVRGATYSRLVDELAAKHLVVLAFQPAEKKQYGVLELENDRVTKIIEWKYWRDHPKTRQIGHSLSNSGIYAVRKDALVRYLPILQGKPHTVLKERDGKITEIQEFFITDLVECFHQDGLKVGYVVAGDEDEVMGIDDLPSLERAQRLFSGKFHL
ncbi:MAG: NTP transferase domain-containing protein [Desulfobacterales bacterium]|nr:NTP transferase domain-containing protein [Desulfobacterales bacterium]